MGISESNQCPLSASEPTAGIDFGIYKSVRSASPGMKKVLFSFLFIARRFIETLQPFEVQITLLRLCGGLPEQFPGLLGVVAL